MNGIEFIVLVAQQVFIHAPVVFGAYISMSLLKAPDLSIESAYVFGALLGAKMVVALQGMSQLVALPCVMLAAALGGGLVGLTSSMLTQRVKLPHLLSSIITFGIFHGVNQLVAASYISLSGHVNFLALPQVSMRQPEFIFLLLIFIVLVGVMFLFLKTQLSCALAAYGYNPAFLKNYGISTQYVFVLGIVMSNALAGLGGYIGAQSNGFADLNMGLGKVLLCITALILGKAIWGRAALGVRYACVGVSAYFLLQQLLLKVGFDLKYFTMVQSLLVLTLLIALYKKQEKRQGVEHIDHLGV